MSNFKIFPVPSDSAQNIEQLGTKRKFWFEDSELGRCLCKLSRPNTGEDWSEKIAFELATVIGLPSAHYELAEYEGHTGVISPVFVPETCTLIHGNEVLGQSDPIYGRSNIGRYHQTTHTL